ncbi:MAG: DUF975 family protein [Eubacteriales bacterium]|nr:DUF975 family protein [Eubacteriales bacterium]
MTTRDYKRNARMVLNGNYMPFVLSRLIFMVVTWIITVFSGNIIATGMVFGMGIGNNIAIISGVVILSLMIDICMLFIGYLFTFGYTKMGLRINRGQKIDIKMALDGFKAESKPWKMVGLSFINGLISFIIMFIPVSMFIIGSYFSIISGRVDFLTFTSGVMLVCSFIVAYISFSLALSVYIIIDHPEISIFAAMKASFRMMRGRRFKLIWLSIFSFFGWHVLNLLTAGVLSIWLEPYIMSSIIQFYMDINGEQFVYTNSEVKDDIKENTSWEPANDQENESRLPVLALDADESLEENKSIDETKSMEQEVRSESENAESDAGIQINEEHVEEENEATEIKENEATEIKEDETEAAKSKTFEELMEELYKENKLKEDNYFGKGDRS